MPLLDMPLPRLLEYEGRNPRPNHFDEFWQRALGELDAIDPQIELVPHEINAPFAECFHLYFTGVGGARVHAKLVRPKYLQEPTSAVLMFHGYSGDSGGWLNKLAYAARGQVVAALDCRGQGGLSNDNNVVSGNTQRGFIIRGLADALNGNGDKLYFRNVFLDTAQLARIVGAMDEVDANRIGATGGSQGGALTLACASLHPNIKKAAAVYPFLCDYQRVWEMDLAAHAYDELKWFFRTYDPQHQREDEIWTALGHIDIQHLTNRIRGEVLMPVGLMDNVCPPSTQFAAYNKIQSAKNTLIYPDFGHEGLPGVDEAIYDFLGDL